MAEKEQFTSPISTRCTEDLRDKLEQLAADDSRPLASYVRLVLEKHVEEANATRSKKKVA
jgi:predicted DNA-binding protein